MGVREDLLTFAEIDNILKRTIEDKGFLDDSKKRKEFFNQAGKSHELKLRIKSEFAKNSVIIIESPSVRKLLQKIADDKPFIADILFDSINRVTGDKYDYNKYNWDDLEQMISDELYSWFGPYDYIERLITIGSLVVGASIPKNLNYFVNEARKSYAFENFNAVYSLCRTILETTMRDIGIRIGKIQQSADDLEFYKAYPPKKLINTVCTGSMRIKIKQLYRELSSIMHGFNTVNEEKAKNTLKETLVLVQELYNNNIHK